MYRRLFSLIKGKIPKISDTELIALRSGNTSLDRSILEGKVIFPQKHIYKKKFPEEKLTNLFKKFDHKAIYPNDNNNKWINHLAQNKFLVF